MSKPEGEIAALAGLAALRANYAARLPEKVQTLADAIRHARENPLLVVEALSAAHRLAGTAGSYGFREISEAASRIDLVLRELRAAVSAEEREVLWRKIAVELDLASAVAARAGNA